LLAGNVARRLVSKEKPPRNKSDDRQREQARKQISKTRNRCAAFWTRLGSPADDCPAVFALHQWRKKVFVRLVKLE
jgi:hypothetical protein